MAAWKVVAIGPRHPGKMWGLVLIALYKVLVLASYCVHGGL
jgi:hypothetical protein